VSLPRLGSLTRTGPYGSRLLGPAHQSTRALRVRVQLLLTVLLVVTNVIGAGAVVSILLLVRPREAMDPDLLVSTFIAVPVYVVLAVVVGATVGTRNAFAALRWAYEDREPTEADRLRTLRVPRTLTAVQAGLWAMATALFSGLALLLDPQLFTTELLAIGITGALICAIAYLVTEFVLRPVAARALADGVPVPARGSGVRRRMIGFWAIGSGVPAAGMVVVGILALSDDQLTLTRLAVVSLVLGTVVLLVGLFITALNARAVVGPISSVRQGLRRLEEGEFGTDIPVYDGTELGLLQSGFNRVSAGLAERERIRDLFGRHVGQEVAEAALAAGVELGGEVRTVSVLFVDLKGSTALATERPPGEVVEVLNRFCSVVIAEVDRCHGLVNKFMGDAVLAVFGAPVERDDHATDALRAARTMADRLRAELAEIDFGVGVATGEAVAGNVGDRERFEYTVIGDAVNSAARLTELAKERPERVLATGVSRDAASDQERGCWTDGGEEVLRGRSDATPLVVPRG